MRWRHVQADGDSGQITFFGKGENTHAVVCRFQFGTISLESGSPLRLEALDEAICRRKVRIQSKCVTRTLVRQLIFAHKRIGFSSVLERLRIVWA